MGLGCTAWSRVNISPSPLDLDRLMPLRSALPSQSTLISEQANDGDGDRLMMILLDMSQTSLCQPSCVDTSCQQKPCTTGANSRVMNYCIITIITRHAS